MGFAKRRASSSDASSSARRKLSFFLPQPELKTDRLRSRAKQPARPAATGAALRRERRSLQASEGLKKLRNLLFSRAGILIHGRSRSTYLDSEMLTSASVDSPASQPVVRPSARRSLSHTPVLCRASPHWVSDGVAASARLFPLLAGLLGEESLATQSAALFKEAGFAVNLIPKRSWRPPWTRLAFSPFYLYSFC